MNIAADFLTWPTEAKARTRFTGAGKNTGAHTATCPMCCHDLPDTHDCDDFERLGFYFKPSHYVLWCGGIWKEAMFCATPRANGSAFYTFVDRDGLPILVHQRHFDKKVRPITAKSDD